MERGICMGSPSSSAWCTLCYSQHWCSFWYFIENTNTSNNLRMTVQLQSFLKYGIQTCRPQTANTVDVPLSASHWLQRAILPAFTLQQVTRPIENTVNIHFAVSCRLQRTILLAFTLQLVAGSIEEYCRRSPFSESSAKESNAHRHSLCSESPTIKSCQP